MRECGSRGGCGIRQRRTMAFKWIWEVVNHTKREPKCSADCLDVRVSGRQEGTNEQEPQRDTLLTPEQNASIRNQWPTYANQSIRTLSLLKVLSLGGTCSQSVRTNVNKSKDKHFSFTYSSVWGEAQRELTDRHLQFIPVLASRCCPILLISSDIEKCWALFSERQRPCLTNRSLNICFS